MSTTPTDGKDGYGLKVEKVEQIVMFCRVSCSSVVEHLDLKVLGSTTVRNIRIFSSKPSVSVREENLSQEL